MDLHQHFIFLGGRFFYLCQFKNLGWPVFCVYHRFHTYSYLYSHSSNDIDEFLREPLSSTTSLITGEPVEKSFFLWLMLAKAGLLAPIFSVFRPDSPNIPPDFPVIQRFSRAQH